MAVLAPGLQLAGRYTLERRLGSGGMAEVWSAFDAERDERVALKVLDARLAAQPGMVELLRNEYETSRACAIRTSCARSVCTTDAEQPFIVFELIEGGRPATLCRPAARSSSCPSCCRSSTRSRTPTRRASFTATSSSRTCSSTRRGSPRLTDFGIASASGPDGSRCARAARRPAMSPQQLAREHARPGRRSLRARRHARRAHDRCAAFAPDASPERIAAASAVPGARPCRRTSRGSSPICSRRIARIDRPAWTMSPRACDGARRRRHDGSAGAERAGGRGRGALRAGRAR